jgi:SNF2 family DNA or RNA helicase
MAQFEIPEEFEELQQWVLNTEEEQRKAVEQIPDLTKEINTTRAEEVELEKKLNELYHKRRENERLQKLLRDKAKAQETALLQAKRKLETFASEKAIQDRLKKDAEEFDRITQHYQWREFAFSHQIDGARRLASAGRGILGDKRGLGKSLTSLIWADMLDIKKVIVFAPKDVLENFKREIQHWAPHRAVTILGGMGKAERTFFLNLMKNLDQYLILCNYEAWRKDASLLELIKDLKSQAVIIDEAHNIKEKSTSAYRGIREIIYADNECNNCGGDPERWKNPMTGAWDIRCSVCLNEPQDFGAFCSVKYVLPMTGTAILNRPQDLWTLLHLVDRRLFPSENTFLRDYCHINPWTNRWGFKPGGEEALIKKLGSRFIKRDKKSAGVATMPQTIVRHDIEFDQALYPDQWEVMEQIKKYGAIKMAEDVKLDVVGILPELMRRRQAITWPAGIKVWETDDEGKKTGRVLYEAPATSSCKMDKAMAIAKEVIEEEEDRLVVFSQFKEALKEFERRFQSMGISVVRYDGDISDAKAVEAQLDFDGKTAPNHAQGTDCNDECVNWGRYCSGYKWQVILCHYKKGGVGLNLNAARQMIILDREWNPGKEDQAVGRIDRMDNTRDSIVHTIHVANTIDGFMDMLIDQKKEMIDDFESTNDAYEKLAQALKDGMM